MSIFSKFSKTFFIVCLLLFSFIFSQESEESNSKAKVAVSYLNDTSLQLENDKGNNVALFLNVNNLTVAQGAFSISTELWTTFDSVSGKKDISINHMIATVGALPNLFFSIYHGRVMEEYGSYYKSFAYIVKPIFNDPYIDVNGVFATIVVAPGVLVYAGANLNKNPALFGLPEHANLAEHFVVVNGKAEVSSDIKLSYLARWLAADDFLKTGHFDFTTNAIHTTTLAFRVNYIPLGIDFFATISSDDALNDFVNGGSSTVGLSWNDIANIPFFDKIHMECRIPYNDDRPDTTLLNLLNVNPLLGVYVDLQVSYGSFYSKLYIQQDLAGDEENKTSYGIVGGVNIPFSTTF